MRTGFATREYDPSYFKRGCHLSFFQWVIPLFCSQCNFQSHLNFSETHALHKEKSAYIFIKGVPKPVKLYPINPHCYCLTGNNHNNKGTHFKKSFFHQHRQPLNSKFFPGRCLRSLGSEPLKYNNPSIVFQSRDF